jgi:hypothetical protein
MTTGVLSFCKAIVPGGPDRIGLLGKPPAVQHFVPLQEPVAVLAFLRSPFAYAGMKQYECGRTQPLFVQVTIVGKLACRNLKG